MQKTTIGQLAIRAGLPEELRGFDAVLDKPGLTALLKEAIKLGPDVYRDVVQHLSNVGRHAAQITGGNSFGPEHLRIGVAARQNQIALDKRLRSVYADPKLSDDAKDAKVIQILTDAGDSSVQNVMREALSDHNPLGLQVASGTRGSPANLRSLIGEGDLLYVDHRNRPIPVPVLSNYSQGLSPAAYYAASFGARKGVLDAKMATQDSGYFNKQINQASHRLVVTALDYDGTEDPDAAPRGLPVQIDDPHNEGSLLAVPLGPYDRNTILTPKVIADLRAKGFERLLVRSPIAGGHPDGGLYARDAGVHERDGGLPPVGDFVGITSASALGEKLTQGSLSSKHSGGVASGDRPVGPSGFKLLDQYLQEPKTFKGGAAHAQEDGRVSSITAAPQGGSYAVINGVKHYIGRGYDPVVKIGDEVEAGDVLSDGIPIPAEVVKHKGIGEGRRYFTSAFVKAYQDAGMSVHRRNVELLSRALIDHVEIDDEMGDHLPGDVVSYSALEHRYEPRKDHAIVPIAHARNKYLERPVLHYSIGTKVRPSVLKTMKEFGVQNVAVHPEPPPFRPRMIRGMENLSHDEDWLVKFMGSYLKKGFLASAHRGAVSDERGTSFVPSLARAVDFGKTGPVQGWKPTGPTPKAPTPSPSILAQMQTPEPADTVMHKAARARLIKQAEDETFRELRLEHPAGHTVELDEDDDYPGSITYHAEHHRLPSHRGEDGEELAVLQGTDPKGCSGSFEILRPGRLRRKTKFYRHCSKEEEDKILREFAPLLTDMPRQHKSADELLEDLARFTVK